MASYAQLRLALENEGLRNKVEMSCVMAANTIRIELASVVNHANRLVWAKRAFNNPESEGIGMSRAVVAQFQTKTLAEIAAVSEAEVQAAVDAAVNIFATGA